MLSIGGAVTIQNVSRLGDAARVRRARTTRAARRVSRAASSALERTRSRGRPCARADQLTQNRQANLSDYPNGVIDGASDRVAYPNHGSGMAQFTVSNWIADRPR